MCSNLQKNKEFHAGNSFFLYKIFGKAIAALIIVFAGGPVPATARDRSLPSPAVRHVRLDVLPDDPDNIVDPLHGDEVPVAILAEPGLDVRTIEPLSLLLAGSPPSKDPAGSLVSYHDVDGDGKEDLVVSFPERVFGTGTGWIQLGGRLLDGTRIKGSDRFQTIQELRFKRRAPRAGPPSEKLAPIPVKIDILTGNPANLFDPTQRAAVSLAILGSSGFEVTAIDSATISLAGSFVTRAEKGKWSRLTDVDGDGRLDLLVHIAAEPLSRLPAGPQEVELKALTRDGRFVEGRDSINVLSVRTVTLSSDQPLSASGAVIESASDGGIVINDNGPATPFPSLITFTQPFGTQEWVGKVRVTLKGLSHTFPADLDVMLVGPQGQSVVLLSDAGGGNPGTAGVDLTFDDDAAEYLSQVANPASGAYKPTNYDDGVPDTFPAPAPVPSHSPGLAAFNGTKPAGTWSLYVVDDAAVDTGTIAGGWSIEILMMQILCEGNPNTGILNIPDDSTAWYYPVTVIFAGSGVVSKTTALIHNLYHPSPADLELLVESPSGQTSLVVSDAGGNTPVSNLFIRFDDDAPAPIPSSTPTTGTYRPFDYDDGIADSFPAPAPGGPYSANLSSLMGSPVSGEWKLYLQDDAFTGSAGWCSSLCLGISYFMPSANSSTGGITIPQGSPSVTSGPSSPYPSTIQISGMSGFVSKLTVEIQGLTHTYPDDLDLLLVGPTGASAILISDVGGSFGATNLSFTLDDAAQAQLPDTTAISPGNYRPTDFEPGDAFPAPAPAGPYGTSLSTFNGSDPNGLWRLYVVDDANGDVGSLLTWKLNISTAALPQAFCNSTALTLPAGAPDVTNGPADVYPSTIQVSGIDFPAGRIRVRLSGLSHTYPGDLDFLLVGPQGDNIIFMSDAGGATDVTALGLQLDDRAPSPISQFGPLTAGTFSPANYSGLDADAFPAPAPLASPATTFLDAFAGTDPNGTWSLYVLDDTLGDVGSMAGWCVEVSPLFVPAPQTGPGLEGLVWDGNAILRLAEWPYEVNLVEHRMYRGEPYQLPALLTPSIDSCLRASTGGYVFGSLNETPPLGSFYWYVVRPANVGGQEGSAGFALTQLGAEARVQDSSGGCP